MILFSCQSCSQALETEDYKAGMTVPCPTCYCAVLIPQFSWDSDPAREILDAARIDRYRRRSKMMPLIFLFNIIMLAVFLIGGAILKRDNPIASYVCFSGAACAGFFVCAFMFKSVMKARPR